MAFLDLSVVISSNLSAMAYNNKAVAPSCPCNIKNEAIPAISMRKFAVIFLRLRSSIASFTTPELERNIEPIARI
ncbi:MAG: hypothetical protein ACFFAA_14055 [Promethearchaeota archaeon]